MNFVFIVMYLALELGSRKKLVSLTYKGDYIRHKENYFPLIFEEQSLSIFPYY